LARRGIFALALVLMASPVAGQPVPQPAETLIPKDPLQIALAWLRTRPEAISARPGDLAEFVVADQYRSERSGVTHLVLRQRIRGIEVWNGDLQINVASDGRIVSAHDGFVRREAARPVAPRLAARQAVLHAAQALGLPRGVAPALLDPAHGSAQAQRFAPGALSRRPIPAELVYYPLASGELRLAWNLEIEPAGLRHAWSINVDAETGEIHSLVDWVSRDAYRAHALPQASPEDGPRSLEVDPADPTASPFGWHDIDGVPGADSNSTEGGNAIAVEDRNADDAGGSPLSGGVSRVFDFPVDFFSEPPASEAAAVTNAFYVVNRLHDIHYHYGFDEAAGNFQETNFGRGGIEGDPVFVDVQDGGSSNNASFFSPPEGTPGVMELYLWFPLGLPFAAVIVQSPAEIAGALPAGDAEFGPVLGAGITGTLARALDPVEGPGQTDTDACSPLTNAFEVSGRIALIDRGVCPFVTKVKNAQLAGAIAVVVVNHQGDEAINMGGVDPSIVIPSALVGQGSGILLEANLASGVVITVRQSSIARDSAFDNSLIAHEYGHGVSSRLSGGPSNPNCLASAQSDGMSEGWSDFWAIAFTALPTESRSDARAIASWVLAEPPGGAGLRNFPYSTELAINPQTFVDIGSTNRPHGVGEIWALALWEVWWNLVDRIGFDPDLVQGSGGNQRMLQLVMDGLKLQPCNPSFLDARDALLTAEQVLFGGLHECDLWRGFAKRGMGVSAGDGGSASSLSVAEAFDLPVQCVPEPGATLLAIVALAGAGLGARRARGPG
jgi:extracellular elastinolytic metalloproteinase